MKIKKRIAGLMAAGLLAASGMAVPAAADSMSSIRVEIQYGYISNIEVNTTFDQLYAELRSRGYDAPSSGSNQKVYTGAEISMWTGKQYRFTLVVSGDINGDGLVDEQDRDKISEYLSAKAQGTQESVIRQGSWEFIAADINEDSKIDIADLMEIIKIIARHAND